MSYYDDASIMFIGGAATGTDGKAGTAKPINGGSPLYVTRGSNLTATRVDSNGLIEKGRENLFTYSNDFSNAAWTKSAATITTNALTSPQGNNNASYLTDNTANNFHGLYAVKNIASVVTCSVFVKYDNKQFVSFLTNNNGVSDRYAYFDLVNKTTHNISSGLTASIEDVGGGWLRLSVMSVSSANGYYWWNIAASNSTTAYIGDGTGRIGIFGAQLEAGLVATQYIESGASTGKAGLLENEPRFNYPIGGSVPHLLLEPQRTNIIGYSEYFDDWQKSEVSLDFGYLAPDGTYSAYKVSALSMSAASLYRSAVELDNTYTRSIWAKTRSGTGVVSLLSYKNNTNNVFTITDEWQRFDVSDVAEATGLGNFYAVDFRAATTTLSEVIIWGAQAEQGSYPTSYIPNHTAGSVTRGSESVTTASVPSLINQNEGVFFVDFEFLNIEANEHQNWFALESENGAERVLIYRTNNSQKIKIYLVANNVLIFSYNSAITATSNTRYKIALKYSTGDIALAINGNIEVTDSSTYTRGSDLSRVLFNESSMQPSCRMHETIVFESGWDNVDLEILTGATPYQSFAAMAATLNYTVYE